LQAVFRGSQFRINTLMVKLSVAGLELYSFSGILKLARGIPSDVFLLSFSFSACKIQLIFKLPQPINNSYY
jgi:hypothetical protein